ncbi:hypothetical protein SAMN02745824_1136 [Parasphingorhabdus marina DSM 22363]|uniref:Uncharacterized protein n=1 Tax=Parasphingorhabdus marina DSM 22363 TaxID=1123272 RepID=A0A1N6CWH7_9SPHN|nr:hypothetical protein [Parasphingorhabdus marina]SIN62835.1 hypothetical protein SAMN02745824_1136 [Parasphingorhabdus marina DSM 22363]
MASLNISEFEAAQRNLVAALDGHSADEILICCEELQQASDDLRARSGGSDTSLSQEKISEIEELNLAARYRIRFLHDMCRARMFMIANQGDSQTYSPL